MQIDPIVLWRIKPILLRSDDFATGKLWSGFDLGSNWDAKVSVIPDSIAKRMMN